VKAGSIAVADTTVDVHLPMADEHIAKIRHKTNQDEDDAILTGDGRCRSECRCSLARALVSEPERATDFDLPASPMRCHVTIPVTDTTKCSQTYSKVFNYLGCSKRECQTTNDSRTGLHLMLGRRSH